MLKFDLFVNVSFELLSAASVKLLEGLNGAANDSS